jgi:membrane-bound metal-dependent hydrolase YbcI (DUF457 family)
MSHNFVFLVFTWAAVVFLAVYNFQPNYFTELCLWVTCMSYAHETYGRRANNDARRR